MKTWAWGAAAAASALLVGFAACQGETAATANNAPGCGTAQYSTMPECEACVESSCCDELLSCTGGTPCDALRQCLVACTAADPTCIASCQAKNSKNDAGAPYMALESCFNDNCATATVCQTGAICQSGLQVPNVSCGACLGSKCCAEWTACGADAKCSGCATSQGANSGCSSDALYAAATACETSMCPEDCTAICCTPGAPDCITTNIPACDTCLTANCCVAFDMCIADSTCDTCLVSSGQGGEGPTCQIDGLYCAVSSCQCTSCLSQCTPGGPGQCMPGSCSE